MPTIRSRSRTPNCPISDPTISISYEAGGVAAASPRGRRRAHAVPAVARKLPHAKARSSKKVRPAPGGEPAAREPGLGTGRGGDMTGAAKLLQREVAVATAGRGSPSVTQVLGSLCDWRLTK